MVDPTTRIHQCAFFKAPAPTIHYLDAEDFHIINPSGKKMIFKAHSPSLAHQERRGEKILERFT